MIYTLVENCKRHGLDPYRCLRATLASLPAGEPGIEGVAHLTPARIAGVRRRDHRTSAA